MRFRSLEVRNLRAVRLFQVQDLTDLVVIAGQNGCGKSCLFDAIRLLKSVYGGAQDEHMQWFGEFAINVQDRQELRRLFRDPGQPMVVRAVIEFTESERQYMREHAADLLWPIAWQRITGQRVDYWSFTQMAIGPQLAQYQQPVEEQVRVMTQALEAALSETSYTLALTIEPDGGFLREECLPAEVSFQADEPNDLGIIEYHSASRAYTRQPLQGINLDAKAFQEQRRQQRLYNWQAKYQNVKTELATGYLRNLIASESGGAVEEEDLNETLKELFRTFFPDKIYEGVRPLPRGSLEFPVRLPGGERHDIDDLSSGEKEILYGYLRLRNSTPRGSVILLDEPELHLNPSLLQGFTDFYHRHLGIAQGNQLWLVTHSDTLLRQAVGNANYRVYHMVTATTGEGNQATEVLLDDDVERVTIDLIGDLAAYRPHAKVVILEGDSEDGFDATVIQRLFPKFAKRVNLVSGGPKRRVQDLYTLLEASMNQINTTNRFFAIVDRDSEREGVAALGEQAHTWDVYHIENFLLEAAAIREAVASADGHAQFQTDVEVDEALRECAKLLVDSLVLERMRKDVNREIVGAIKIGGAPKPKKGASIGGNMLPSIEGSLQRVAAAGQELTAETLDKRAAELRTEFEAAVASGAWRKDFPGREILKLFVGQNLSGISYTTFRNLVLDKMAIEAVQPSAMKGVLDQIEAA